LRFVTIALAMAFTTLALPATPASAHPLGNFSVNQYAGLTFSPEDVIVVAVVNTAEIPTRQDRPAVLSNGNADVEPTLAQRAAYAVTACADLAA